MKFCDCIIAWTPIDDMSGMAGLIEVGPSPDKTGWTKKYRMVVSASPRGSFEPSHWEEVAQILSNFHSAVVRDGINPQAAHAAFLSIDEYRHSISPDIIGATRSEDSVSRGAGASVRRS